MNIVLLKVWKISSRKIYDSIYTSLNHFWQLWSIKQNGWKCQNDFWKARNGMLCQSLGEAAIFISLQPIVLPYLTYCSACKPEVQRDKNSCPDTNVLCIFFCQPKKNSLLVGKYSTFQNQMQRVILIRLNQLKSYFKPANVKWLIEKPTVKTQSHSQC